MKRLLAGILAAVLCLCLTGLPVTAEEGYDTTVREIRFFGGDTVNNEFVCYYSDGYFASSAYEYDPSLATMTLSLACSAFGVQGSPLVAGYVSEHGALFREIYGSLDADIGKEPYLYSSQNASALLAKCGFDRIGLTETYKQKPSADSIAAIFGLKTLPDCTLVAVAVRGAGYGAEWASNFTVGKEGNHQGFSEARDFVLNELNAFLGKEKVEGKLKLWVTGYSRAAATANMLGGALDEGKLQNDAVSIAPEDVYCYTFETPAGALRSKVYDPASNGYPNDLYENIFNIVNLSDPVQYVAPAAYGLCRYGIDLYLPSPETDPEAFAQDSADYKRMRAIYDRLPAQDGYVVNDFTPQKILIDESKLPLDLTAKDFSLPLSIEADTNNRSMQGSYMTKLLMLLANDYIGDRDRYAEVWQSGIRLLLSATMGLSDAELASVGEAIAEEAKTEAYSLVISLMSPSLTKLLRLGTPGEILFGWAEKAFRKNGLQIEEKEGLKAFADTLVSLGKDLAFAHPELIATLVSNLGSIASAHMPQVCFAWLAAMDPHYGGEGNLLSNGDYRVLRVTGEADLTVKNSGGKTVVTVKNGTPDPDSPYLAGTDENGQKFVILPAKADYECTLLSTADGKITLSVCEYASLLCGCNRGEYLFDYPMQKGETLAVSLPAYNEQRRLANGPGGSEVEYTRTTGDGKATPFTEEKRGEGDIIPLCHVEAKLEDPENGMILGAGICEYGSTVRLKAVSLGGVPFAGWFDPNGKLITKESELLCPVRGDVTVIGSFTEPPPCTHQSVVLQTEKAPDCVNAGYTGDKVCADCGEVLETGKELPAIGHTYKDGLCLFCGEKAPDYFAKRVLPYILSGVGFFGAAVLLAVVLIRKKKGKR